MAPRIITDNDAVRDSASRVDSATDASESTDAVVPVTDSRFAALSEGAEETSRSARDKLRGKEDDIVGASDALKDKDEENASGIASAAGSPATSASSRPPASVGASNALAQALSNARPVSAPVAAMNPMMNQPMMNQGMNPMLNQPMMNQGMNPMMNQPTMAAPTSAPANTGNYQIKTDDLARIISNAQSSGGGGGGGGGSSGGGRGGGGASPTSGGGIGDVRSTGDYGDVPFVLGEISDEGVMDPMDVTFERDPEDATLTDDELSAVINAALDLNGVTDDPEVRGKWEFLMKFIGENESNLVVNAGNGWDSNAIGATQEDGLPLQSSRGIWQTIYTTFAANHVPGTSTSIYDPTASCAAAVNYLMQRYNCDPETGAGLDEFYNRRSGGYIGY